METRNDQDCRSLILKDMLTRLKNGDQIRKSTQEYAEWLGISEARARFNLNYLIDTNLVEGKTGKTIVTMGFGDPYWREASVSGLTTEGIDLAEGHGKKSYDVNYKIINVIGVEGGSKVVVAMDNSAPVHVEENTTSIFNNLYKLVQEGPSNEQAKAQAMELLRELQTEVGNDSVKPSTLKRIARVLETYGPAAVEIVAAISKAIGLK